MNPKFYPAIIFCVGTIFYVVIGYGLIYHPITTVITLVAITAAEIIFIKLSAKEIGR